MQILLVAAVVDFVIALVSGEEGLRWDALTLSTQGFGLLVVSRCHPQVALNRRCSDIMFVLEVKTSL